MEQLTAIIVCTRVNSTRIPLKPIRMIGEYTLIEHLVIRLKKTGLPVILACPEIDYDAYAYMVDKYGVILNCIHPDDPMSRMSHVANLLGLKQVIRVSHDKMLIDPSEIKRALELYLKNGNDYLYSSSLTDGSGFEIIDCEVLSLACKKWKNIEHISYAIKSLAKNKHNYKCSPSASSPYRFLIDYENDMVVMKHLVNKLGSDVTLQSAINYMDTMAKPWLLNLNKLPTYTVYTCAYNAERWIDKCIGSVIMQNNFKDVEYIIIDDASTDSTTSKVARVAHHHSNIRLIQNPRNVGLSSSSNVALKNARGKYIIRLDADDYFIKNDTLEVLHNTLLELNADVVYPDNIFGSEGVIQSGDEKHHVGGSLFNTKAINNFKFMEGLRGFEGLDLFERAKDQFKIAYHKEPMFFYRQHENSMSKTNLSERASILKEINVTCT